MSIRYLYPCPECQHKIELVGRQAGQSITCPECSAKTEAPKLGTLRQLETIGEATNSRSTRSASGGSWRNMLFVCGLGLAILSGACGYFLFQYAQSKYTAVDFDEIISDFEANADKQAPTGLMMHYESLNVDGGLPEWSEQPYIGENKQSEILKYGAFVLFGLCGIGLAMLVCSFFAPK